MGKVSDCGGHKMWISGGLEWRGRELWIRQMNRCGNQLKNKEPHNQRVQKRTMRPSPTNKHSRAEESKGALSLRFNYSSSLLIIDSFLCTDKKNSISLWIRFCSEQTMAGRDESGDVLG